MEPEVKTGFNKNSFWLGFGTAAVVAVASAWLIGKKDRVLSLDGTPHLLFRPLTPCGEALLNNITVRVNNEASSDAPVVTTLLNS